MKESFIFLAEGFEEIEALTAVDVLRRGGMTVKTVSITSALQVTGAHGITVTADVLYDNTLFREPAWLILPGGLPGATNLAEFAPLRGLLGRQATSEGGRIAAICAAPAEVLGRLGLLKEERATCYPGFQDKLDCKEFIDTAVVESGKYILGNGPANAMVWALTIVKADRGPVVAEQVAAGMLFHEKADIEGSHYFG